MDLSTILEHEQQGKLELALQEIDDLVSSCDVIGPNEIIELASIKSRILNQLGQYDEALKIIEKVEKSLELDETNLGGEIITQKALALWRLGQYKRAITQIELVEKLLHELDHTNSENIKEWEGSLYYIRATIAIEQNQSQRAIEYYQKSLYVFQLLQNQLQIGKILNNLGGLERNHGKYEAAEQYFCQALSIFESLENTQNIAMVYNNLGGIYLHTGRYSDAIENYEKSLRLYKLLQSKQDIAQILHNLSIIYYRRGNLDSALNYQEKSLELRVAYGDIKGITWSQKTIGDILQDKGELDKALDYYQKCLMTRQKLGVKNQIAQSLHDIGKIYYKIGEEDLAESHFKRSLEKFEEINNNFWASETLFYLILLYLDLGNITDAATYLEKLQSLADHHETQKLIYYRSKLSKALILKKDSRFVSKLESQKLFQEILEDGFVEFKITTMTMINLCELLLLEFRTTEEESILDEVRELITELSNISLDQQSYTLYIETLILRSKLLLSQYEIEDALKLLEEAAYTCNERSLLNLQDKVREEQELLIETVKTWDRIVESNSSFLDRITETDIVDYIEDIANYLSQI